MSLCLISCCLFLAALYVEVYTSLLEGLPSPGQEIKKLCLDVFTLTCTTAAAAATAAAATAAAATAAAAAAAAAGNPSITGHPCGPAAATGAAAGGSAAAAAAGPRRSSVAVAAALLRHKLVHASDIDAFLAAEIQGGQRQLGAFEFAIALLRLLHEQQCCNPADWQRTTAAIAAAPVTSEQQQLEESRNRLLEALKIGNTQVYCCYYYYCCCFCCCCCSCCGCGWLVSLLLLLLYHLVVPIAVTVSLHAVLPFSRSLSVVAQDDSIIYTLLSLLQQQQQQQQQPVVRQLACLPPVSPQQQQLVERVFRDWLLLCAATSGGGAAAAAAAAERSFVVRATFFQRISHQGLLRMDDHTDRFFAVSLRLAVSAAAAPLTAAAAATTATDTAAAAAAAEEGAAAAGAAVAPSQPLPETKEMDVFSVDAFVRMIAGMMVLVDPQQISPVTILQRATGIICRAIHQEAEAAAPVSPPATTAAAGGVAAPPGGSSSSSSSSSAAAAAAVSGGRGGFRQRPYFRIFLLLLQELVVESEGKGQEKQALSCLLTLAERMVLLSPFRVPAFAFAWLEFIGHHLFLPRVARQRKLWGVLQRLLTELFLFLRPFMMREQLTDATRLLYRATLRLLLVLLHDFPEFLCDNNYALCEALPLNCIQLRNLILSAFPRTMKLPDPFLPNLKVDLLPDIKLSPRVLSPFNLLLYRAGVKQLLDTFCVSRAVALLPRLLQLLQLPPERAIAAGTKYDLPLVNAFLLYLGTNMQARAQQPLPPQQPGGAEVAAVAAITSPSQEILLYVFKETDMEGRYLLLSAIANHLRYPNAHTHYYSCLLLWLFSDSKNELVREQITRVLLERLIVHRPHPWGLLITFIELIKNPR